MWSNSLACFQTQTKLPKDNVLRATNPRSKTAQTNFCTTMGREAMNLFVNEQRRNPRRSSNTEIVRCTPKSFDITPSLIERGHFICPKILQEVFFRKFFGVFPRSHSRLI